MVAAAKGRPLKKKASPGGPTKKPSNPTKRPASPLARIPGISKAGSFFLGLGPLPGGILAACLVLLVVWLLLPGPDHPVKPPPQPTPRKEAPASPARFKAEDFIYEERSPDFNRHLALTDAAIISGLRSAGLADEAIQVSRVVNVVQEGLAFERAEMEMDLADRQVAEVEEVLLAALGRLDFPVTLSSSGEQESAYRLEVWLDGRLSHTLIFTPAPPMALGLRGKGAIIIDDLGYHPQSDERLIDLELELTLAFLPLSPKGPELARLAAARGREIIVHLPMEPHGYPQINPGPGALLSSMDETELRRTLGSDLADYPQAVGANNHMGSKLTEDESRMSLILESLRERGLFFIDSATSPDSRALDAAGRLGLRAARRSVFLDNVIDEAAIQVQLRRFIARAREEGSAIAIGHPHPQTRAVLLEMAAEMEGQIDLVPATALVR